MMQWARADLADAASTPGVQWLVAVFHHPPYTKGSHDSDTEIELVEMRANFLPVLVRFARSRGRGALPMCMVFGPQSWILHVCRWL